MKSFRILGILILLVGVVMIGTSQYIQKQVLGGKEEISRGEQKVETGRTLFGITPATKEVGNTVIFNSADKKIAAGKEQVAHYEKLADQLQIGGIVAIIAGAALILFSFKKKK